MNGNNLRVDNRECYNYGQAGHISRYCPLPDRRLHPPTSSALVPAQPLVTMPADNSAVGMVAPVGESYSGQYVNQYSDKGWLRKRVATLEDIVGKIKEKHDADEAKERAAKEEEEWKKKEKDEEEQGCSRTSVAKPIADDDVVLWLKREQGELRAATDRRFALTKVKEDAETNAELWKAEALRPGNKRGSIAVASTPISHARVRQRNTPSGRPTEPRINQQLKEIVERHNMEVNLLKEMRLKDVNDRIDVEKEVERLKDAMAKLVMERERETNLKSRLDEVAGPSACKAVCPSVKKKGVDTPEE
ncbi:hypothetical protein CBR_g36455 [Chara braunii]|uniref:CCHC-type domain-containing protein n=1 Tax=Chara braunii TaxID=69332 RepID=A0A388LKS7_CHABU|nr:hypothetical protein CBR_g36455 [Chara braunii]|eukprot:GBG82928.1 hypothetical protein CBR_g36455 [Chara braunii]